jgi:hypothetical protein
MGFFKPHIIVCNVPIEKAQAVMEKITGEFGKFVRDSYDRHPFTGKINDKSFTIMPNRQHNAIKLKGKINSENMNQVRVEVKGQFMVSRMILFLLIALPVLALTILLISTVVVSTQHLIGLVAIFFPLLFLAHIYHLILGQPKSDYNEHVYELMRKMDRHELVL